MQSRGKISIMHILGSLHVGGAERVLVSILERLDRTKFVPYVCCIRDAGPLKEILDRNGVPVFNLAKRSRFDCRVVLQIARLLRRHRIDIARTLMTSGNTWGRLGALLARTPSIISSEHNPVSDRGRSEYLWIDRLLNRRTDYVVAISMAVGRSLSEAGVCSPDKIRMVYNGIDLETFVGQARDVNRGAVRAECSTSVDDFVVTMVGILKPQKDYETLLETVKELVDNDSTNPSRRMCFWIVGDGPLRQYLEQRARGLGIAAYVRFLGFRSDVSKLLAASDAMVLTSRWEGFGNVLIEGMALSLPVVATNVGSVPEIVVDSATGILVPARAPAATANAIRRLASDEELARMMGRAGLDRVRKQFTLDQTVQGYQELYYEAMRRKGGVARIAACG